MKRFNHGSSEHSAEEVTQSDEIAPPPSADDLHAAALPELHCRVFFKEMVAKAVYRKTVSFGLKV